MRKTHVLFVFSLFLLLSELRSQHYYQDIVSNQNNHEQFQLMKKLRVTRVGVKSLEPTGEVTDGFFMEQVINNSYSQLKTSTQLPGAKQRSVLVNYYNQQGYLYRTVDSSENAVTSYEYGYNPDGKLASVINTSRSDADKTKTTESHLWFYNDKGIPEKMLRIRENADTMEIRLLADDKGKITEEKSIRKGVAGDNIFYYYDESGRLTDIVRYQDRLGKLIPDYTFDYDAEGRLSEMMVVQQSGKDYLI
ncbi:MAG TPA: hypothetical protein VLA58_05525, partial [Chitinophagaceae bacterium]|nr:hypothetical protein [Chitinophagaceae bacterium]